MRTLEEMEDRSILDISKDLVRHLKHAGITVKKTDKILIRMIDENLKIRHDAWTQIQSQGLTVEGAKGAEVPNPYLKIMQSTDGVIIKLLTLFGASPMARSQILNAYKAAQVRDCNIESKKQKLTHHTDEAPAERFVANLIAQ